MSTRRDDLAWEIFSIDNAAVPDEVLRPDFPQEAGYAQHIAEGLLAAGYRKPRTIQGPYEDGGPEDLPALSVVLSGGSPAIMQHDRTFMDHDGSSWDFWEMEYPLTVLCEPTPGGAA